MEECRFPRKSRYGEADPSRDSSSQTRISTMGCLEISPLSPGSSVMVESSTSRCIPRGIMVGRVITPLWGDGWTPMKVINITDKPLTLRRHSKLADVSPCVAVEDLSLFQGSCQRGNSSVHISPTKHTENTDLKLRLQKCGLGDVDVDHCEVSPPTKAQLVTLLEKYHDVFSKHHLDCEESIPQSASGTLSEAATGSP